MAARILVAYTTEKGSTAGIAGAIGKELQSAGYSADVTVMKTVSSLAGYNAVVIGGPVYMGKMTRDFGRFLGRYREELAKLPVAAFVVGMAPASKDPVEINKVIIVLHVSLASLKPVAETAFAGVVDPEKLGLIQRKMVKMAKAPVGDFRDWDAIAAWARELPAKMGV
jgi:menaquinone-dependent protoporphyrinogen oxidase